MTEGNDPCHLTIESKFQWDTTSSGSPPPPLAFDVEYCVFAGGIYAFPPSFLQEILKKE